MAIIGTLNGINIIAVPSDVIAGVRGPSSIEWDEQEVVAVSVSPFTGQTQTYDWQQSWWEGQVSFAPMCRRDHDAWAAFISACRGPLNAFSLGDPKAKLPKGAPSGAPVVNGAAQTGFSLLTRGWTPSRYRLLLAGDYLQIGYRLYKVIDAVNSDPTGHATISVWPPLRDAPADATPIVLNHCKGLFRLKNASGNKHSVNFGNYGMSGFAIREAI